MNASDRDVLEHFTSSVSRYFAPLFSDFDFACTERRFTARMYG